VFTVVVGAPDVGHLDLGGAEGGEGEGEESGENE
jgi:hypothetical protein